MTNFEIGKTYFCRSICDHECIYRFEVIKRTAKMVTIKGNHGQVSRKVRVRDGIECLDPHGRYSMSPVLYANKVAA